MRNWPFKDHIAFKIQAVPRSKHSISATKTKQLKL